MGMEAMSLTAPIFGILGAALIAIFVAGGSSNDDGQGTNVGWARSLSLQKAGSSDSAFFMPLTKN